MYPVIGLTGLPCSGKSMVARFFENLGACVIDVDKIGHDAHKETEIKKRISSEFGKEVFNKSGEIDRQKLSSIVFTSPQKLDALESIMHPTMCAKVKLVADRQKQQIPVIIDAAILFRIGLHKFCDRIFVCTATIKKRIERAKSREWDEKQLLERDGRQVDDIEKLLQHKNTLVIENNGSPEKLRETIKTIWKEVNNGC